jgi:2-hydroxychromene-2-carboxylate isomerase
LPELARDLDGLSIDTEKTEKLKTSKIGTTYGTFCESELHSDNSAVAAPKTLIGISAAFGIPHNHLSAQAGETNLTRRLSAATVNLSLLRPKMRR